MDMSAVVQHLEGLVVDLQGGRRWRIPEVTAACEALLCAVVLLRTQQDGPSVRIAGLDPLPDAIGLARSTVEAIKFAAREQVGERPGADARHGDEVIAEAV